MLLTTFLIAAAATTSTSGGGAALFWTAAGVVVAIVGVAITLGVMVFKGAGNWRRHARADAVEDQQVLSAGFGDGDRSAVAMEHSAVAVAVIALSGRVRKLEVSLEKINEAVTKIVQRTEENGGSSMKDQLNKIIEYIEKDDS